MKAGPRKIIPGMLLAAILLLVIAITALMVKSSIDAPDPASRTPEGAMPPEGEPMRPTPRGATLAAPLEPRHKPA